MSIIVFLILLLMFITPIISVLTVMLKFSEMKRAVSWPKASGEVTDVRVLKSGQQYQPEIDVAYTVEGNAYSSRQNPVSQKGQTKGSKNWAREFTLQFKPGTAVAIYYDPQRPKRATLNPQQMKANDPRLQLTSAFMIVLSIVLHLLGASGLIDNYLNLTGSTVVMAMIVTTVVTLVLGAALALLVQEMRQPKT